MPAAAFAALRSSSFRTYLTGYAAASTGTWMRSVAQDWLVLELTGSPAAVGVTMACQFLPVLLLGLHGGLWPTGGRAARCCSPPRPPTPRSPRSRPGSR